MPVRLRRKSLRVALARSGFAADVEELAQCLAQRGHARRTIEGYAYAAAHLLVCVHRHRRQLVPLSRDTLRAFARGHAQRCRCSGAQLRASYFVAVASHLLPILARRHAGVVEAPAVPRDTAAARHLTAFARYLEETRGLRPSGRTLQVRCVRAFLDAAGVEDVADLPRGAGRAFIHGLAGRSGRSTVSNHVSSLRSFSRFLQVQGHPAAAAVGQYIPATPAPSRGHLPRACTAPELARLLAGVDRTTRIGKRTWAALQLALGLGLRASDIARLTLDDVDWRAGVLRVRAPKERRDTQLPLPRAAGEALVDYLRHGRPATACRHLFVRHFFPVGGPVSGHNLTIAMLAVTRRLGLRHGARGLHALRHTMASRLVQEGASLKEVADVLRHRNVSTTEGYARVDWPRLAEVALPWAVPVVDGRAT